MIDFTISPILYEYMCKEIPKEIEAPSVAKNKSMINEKILDAIIDDNEEEFIKLIVQAAKNNLNINQKIFLTKYKFPRILSANPTYSALCAFFGAEKCFRSFTKLYQNGIYSDDFQRADCYERTLLHYACAGGNLNIIRELWQAGFDLNAKDNENCMPCHFSAMAGTIDAYKFLWMNGADILGVGSSHISPIDVACLYGNIEIVKLIFEWIIARQFFMSTNYQFNSKATNLHYACEGGHANIVNYILSYGNYAQSQINVTDFYGRTPIQVACKNGSLECVKLLLKTGKAEIYSIYHKNHPLVEASIAGHADIVKFLIQNTNIDIDGANSSHLTSLEAAVQNGHLPVIEVLIQNGAGKTLDETKLGRLFLNACTTLNNNIIKLIDNSFTIPYEKMGAKFMKQACKLESKSLVTFLMERNCTFDSVDDKDLNFRSNFTPFMTFLKEKGVDFSYLYGSLIVKAIKTGGLNSLKKMISEGVEINQEIITKNKLLNYACKYGKLDFFSFFMNYKPPFDDSAECFNDLIEKLEESRYNNNNKKVNDCLKIAEILLKDFKVNANDEAIISKALSYCSVDLLELLSKYGANFDCVTLNFSEIMQGKYISLIDFLIEKVSDINSIRSTNGDPIIVESIRYDNSKLVKRLISGGAILNEDIISQYNLIEYACYIRNLRIFNILIELAPEKVDGTACLEKLFTIEKKGIIFVNMSRINEMIEIADTLLSKYGANPSDELAIEFAISISNLQILELFAKHGADFNSCHLNFSRMISARHIPVFHFLKEHGCTFQKIKNEDENDSPIKINFKQIMQCSYDINTLLFLIDYSSCEDVLSLETHENVFKYRFNDNMMKNIIDVLLSFNCFDGILKVYNKLNRIIFPRAMNVNGYYQQIQSCNNQILKNMFTNPSNFVAKD